MPSLRAREWRCLLLAFALLAAWARVLLPAHAVPHGAEGVRGLVCAIAPELPADPGLQAEACEACRLPDLPGFPLAPAFPALAPRLELAWLQAAGIPDAPSPARPLPPARGPPSDPERA